MDPSGVSCWSWARLCMCGNSGSMGILCTFLTIWLSLKLLYKTKMCFKYWIFSTFVTCLVYDELYFFKHLHDSYLFPVCLSWGHLKDVFRPICQRRLKQLKIFHGIQKSSKKSSLNFSGHWKILKEELAYMCGALYMYYTWISGKGSIMWIGHLLGLPYSNVQGKHCI